MLLACDVFAVSFVLQVKKLGQATCVQAIIKGYCWVQSQISDTVLAPGKVSLLMGLAQIISIVRQMMDTTAENRGKKYWEKKEMALVPVQ